LSIELELDAELVSRHFGLNNFVETPQNGKIRNAATDMIFCIDDLDSWIAHALRIRLPQHLIPPKDFYSRVTPSFTASSHPHAAARAMAQPACKTVRDDLIACLLRTDW
jgi:hypothetical protein